MVEPALLLAIAPTTLMGAMTTNVLAMTHGKRLSNWYWNRFYRSRREIVMYKESDPDKYILGLVTMAMMKEEEGYETNCRKITIPYNTLYLIADPNYKYHSTFFDNTGKLIRNHIYFPVKNFIIESNAYQNKKGNSGKTKILICPVSDGQHVTGYEAWTYQWFWGGCLSDSLTPGEACRAMRQTINEIQSVPTIQQRMRVLHLATGKMPPNDDADKAIIKQYIVFYHKLLDPNYVPVPNPPANPNPPVNPSVNPPASPSVNPVIPAGSSM